MRKFVAATTVIAAFVFSGFANAADMPMKAPMAAPVSNWTGFYIGANGGYGWKDPTVSYTPNDPGAFSSTCGGGGTCVPPASFNLSGGLIGGQVGYNYQFNAKWLAGVEADFDWAKLNGSGNSSFFLNSYGPGPATFTASETIKSFGTLRGRLGYLPTNFLLIYGTGGLAYGDVSARAVMPNTVAGTAFNSLGGFSYECGLGTGNANCFDGASSKIMMGWTIGAGVEYMIANNLTLKAEYLYANLGHRTINTAAIAFGGGTAPASFTADFGTVSFNVVRFGMNYKFN
jgi:outer membrane immunogenic protein